MCLCILVRLPSRRVARRQFPDRTVKRVRFLPEAALTRGIIKMLARGLAIEEWRHLNLFRKIIRGGEIAVGVYENAADHEYRIVR